MHGAQRYLHPEHKQEHKLPHAFAKSHVAHASQHLVHILEQLAIQPQDSIQQSLSQIFAQPPQQPKRLQNQRQSLPHPNLIQHNRHNIQG